MLSHYMSVSLMFLDFNTCPIPAQSSLCLKCEALVCHSTLALGYDQPDNLLIRWVIMSLVLQIALVGIFLFTGKIIR